MSHEVESMFYCGEKPWHKLGEEVAEAQTSADAIRLAKLDWEVIQTPVFTYHVPKGEQQSLESKNTMRTISNMMVNVRQTDGKILGVVSDRYKVVQNKDAFAFTDELMGANVRYETAGSLYEGRKIWLMAKLDDYKILDDNIQPYLVFTNSHDGTSAVRVIITPIRVVCQNTLNLALANASRSWSAVHLGDISKKITDARDTLELTDHYLNLLKAEAEKLNKMKVSDEQFDKIVEHLIPLPPVHPEKAEAKRRHLLLTWKSDNLANFKNTGWAAVNSVSDFATHYRLQVPKESQKERLFNNVLDGHELIDATYAWIKRLAS